MAQAGSAGEKLGKYTLRGTLGRGAMGTVYDGWDPAIDRRVAIKTVKLTDTEDEETAEALARFKREAQAAGRLSHPNIVGVYDYGETADLAYIVMEFVEGRSLKSLLDQEKRLPPSEAGTIMQQVLAGLGYSHARGVVHRDIKPANIMLTTEGQVKIADFGIARIESSSMTSVGTVMGTPAYMPPEQFLGEPVDARSDIYAAGVMLFHLLTGVRPYEGSMTSIMQKVLSADPPPAASASAALPAVFDAVIAGAMAKAPAARYPSAGAFAQALRNALDAAQHEPDADETMVAPVNRGRTGSDATASMRRKAQPVDAAAAKATPPVEADSPARKGAPVALFAGLGGVLLVAGVGAWLVLQPGAPKPPAAVTPGPVTPGPVAPPPAPTPKLTAEQLSARVAASVKDVACSDLYASAETSGKIGVSGFIGDDQPEQDIRRTADAAAGTTVDWSVQAVPKVYCKALAILSRARSSSAAGAMPLAISMNGSAGAARLQEGAPIVPTLIAPAFPAWVSVDYLSSDGTMSHLIPKPIQSGALHRPGETIAISARDSGCVSEPFGTDLVISVAAARPLFGKPRPAGESTADYLDALGSALSAAAEGGESIADGALAIRTRPADADAALPAGQRHAVVVTLDLPMRTTPHPSAPVRAYLAECEPLIVQQQMKSGGQVWLLAKAGDATGWIPAGGVQIRAGEHLP